jgi:hypothetical protein
LREDSCNHQVTESEAEKPKRRGLIASEDDMKSERKVKQTAEREKVLKYINGD